MNEISKVNNTNNTAGEQNIRWESGIEVNYVSSISKNHIENSTYNT